MQARLAGYQAELGRVRTEILAKPVQSVSDMVDRLLLVSHDVGWIDSDSQERLWPTLAGALAAARITPAECCDEDPSCHLSSWRKRTSCGPGISADA